MPVGINEPIEVRFIALMGSNGFRQCRRSRACTRHGARSRLRYRVEWLAACVRRAPASVRAFHSLLEQALADFAQVPYHGARTLRELEQMLDDLADLTGAPGTRRRE
jgi:hypothetical protein